MLTYVSGVKSFDSLWSVAVATNGWLFSLFGCLE